MYSMHLLLRKLMLSEVDTDGRRQYREPSIALMSNLFPFNPETDKEKLTRATFLSPHVARHVELAREAEHASQPHTLLMF